MPEKIKPPFTQEQVEEWLKETVADIEERQGTDPYTVPWARYLGLLLTAQLLYKQLEEEPLPDEEKKA